MIKSNYLTFTNDEDVMFSIILENTEVDYCLINSIYNETKEYPKVEESASISAQVKNESGFLIANLECIYASIDQYSRVKGVLIGDSKLPIGKYILDIKIVFNSSQTISSEILHLTITKAITYQDEKDVTRGFCLPIPVGSVDNIVSLETVYTEEKLHNDTCSCHCNNRIAIKETGLWEIPTVFSIVAIDTAIHEYYNLGIDYNTSNRTKDSLKDFDIWFNDYLSNLGIDWEEYKNSIKKYRSYGQAIGYQWGWVDNPNNLIINNYSLVNKLSTMPNNAKLNIPYGVSFQNEDNMRIYTFFTYYNERTLTTDLNEYTYE